MMTEQQKAFLAKQKEPKEQTPGFDLRSTIRNKEGEAELEQPFFMHLQGSSKYFERPLGSGNLFFEDNSPAGRVEVDVTSGKKTFNFEAEHKSFHAPISADMELQEKAKALEAQNEAMRKELAAIKGEAEAKEKDAKLSKPEKN